MFRKFLELCCGIQDDNYDDDELDMFEEDVIRVDDYLPATWKAKLR